VTVTGSIGIAVTDADADAEAVLRNADIAMYAGKGRYAVFEPQMRTRTLQRFNASHVQRPAASTPSVRPTTS
jgi:GGDEF domain-containing protein